MRKTITHISNSCKQLLPQIKRLTYMVPLWLMILCANTNLYAQTSSIRVTGTVSDPKGEKLIGVTVKVKGTALAAVTDINGAYSINVPDKKSVLVYTYIGYSNKEEVVGDRKVINTTLSDASSSLSEVIVTGYGQTVKKSDLVGSIGSVSAKQIQERQPTSLADALEGQISGAQVTTDGGDPFSQGTIQIRGASTLSAGNNPLYVIDGVLNDDASFLNPQDILNIEVLKDAASSAIYGVRGANGVIIITTKGGKEGKAKITANYYHLFGKLAHKLQTTSAKDLTYFRRVLNGGAGTGAAVNPDSVSTFDNKDNDYQDLLYRTGNKDNLNLNISGGQKGLLYYLGLNYFDDRSIIINSYAKSFNTQFNVDYQATEKFKITNKVSFGYVTGNRVDVGNTASTVFQRNPWVSLYRPDGSMAGYVESKRNPVAFALIGENVPTNYIIQDNITANYNIFKDLRFTTSFNARMDNTGTETFIPLSITSGALGPNSGSSNTDTKFSYEIQTYLNYNKKFGKDHNISAVLGYSRDHHKDSGFNITLQNYLTEEVRVSSVADLVATGINTYVNSYYATESVFARVQYGYKDKYIVNGTFRRDGSSRFGEENQFGNFGAGGFAWRFSAEPFMAWSKKFLDDAKLRYSIGVLGNDNLKNDFLYAVLLNFGVGDNSNNSGTYFGNNGVYLNGKLGNKTLHWEETTTQNLGMDLTMFNGRLTVTPEYYFKKTDGLLSNQILPEETGLKSGAINLGNIQNQGFELTVNATPVSTKNFSWNVNGNVTFQNASLITYLVPTATSINGSYLIKEGGHIGDFYLLKNMGVYQYDVSNAYDAAGNRLTPVGVNAAGTAATGYTNADGSPYSGAIRQMKRNGKILNGGSTIWQDINNDGTIDESDRQVLGNAVPKTYWGITNFFTYKRFTLNVTFNASFGGKVYNSIANGLNVESSNYTPPTVAAIYNSWRKPGDVAIYPNMSGSVKDTYGSIANGENSLYLEDASFIRLASAKLTYNLPSNWLKKIGASTFNLYVYGNNLATWTNYSWYDPEFTTSNFLQPGFDNGKYPRRREVGLGLNIQF
jgi:TonB-linked SusC/RagA family outer membrane protein